MAEQDNLYSYTDCFEHEATTTRYTLTNGKELSVYDLITLAIKDDNYDYIHYLIFKQSHILKELIKQKTRFKDFTFTFTPDINPYNVRWLEQENYYEGWINYYKQGNDISIEDLVERIVKNKHWDILYYIYYREDSKLEDFMVNKEQELNEPIQQIKAFYII